MAVRFLILTQYFEPEIGAPQVRLGALARALGARGHEVEVVTGMPNHPNGRIDEAYRGRTWMTEHVDGVTIHRVWLYAATGSGGRRVLNYVSFCAMSLIGLARARRPDVVFVESPPPLLVLPARLAGWLWRRPVIMNVADLWPDAAQALGLLADGPTLRVLRWLEGWSYRAADRICAVTDGVRATLEHDKGVPASKVIDLPNGVDTEAFAPDRRAHRAFARFGVTADDVFLYAGTIGYAHGVETLVDAMVLLRETHPSAHLLIVGGGSERAAVERRISEAMAGNVTLAGPVPVAEVAPLFASSTAAVSVIRDSPLLEGARPGKLFPAMASGVPVLYSGAGEGAAIVREAGAGLVVAPEDPAALADAMRRVLDDPAQAAAMGAAGRRLVERSFSWDTIIDRWLSELGAPAAQRPQRPEVGDRRDHLRR